jgi:hypothetical protein
MALSQDRNSWMLGAMDAFYNRACREDVNDSLAYASGRVEGEAWRLSNLDLGEQLRKNRLPYLVTTKNIEACATSSDEPPIQ